MRRGHYRAIVIGGSAGGFEALRAILPALGKGFPLPILIVQHLHPSDDELFASHLARLSKPRVIVPCDKQAIEPGCIYVAPANYHLLVEHDETIALSIDERVYWSRPSIDVLFASAARVWGEALIAVILSGANGDGAAGMATIKNGGGLTIAQDPASCEHPVMPQAAIAGGGVTEILGVSEIGRRLAELGEGAQR